MKKAMSVFTAVLLVASVLVGCFLGYMQIMPINTPADFSESTKTLSTASESPDLDLMLTHLKAMSSAVHSVDSEGMAVTQAYLHAQLDEMGYQYSVEKYELPLSEVLELETARAAFRGKTLRSTEESIRDYSGIGDKPTMNLTNTVVTIDAPNTDETVILVAHIDSVKFGPGTFDDTVSCTGLLEALRLLKGVTPVRDLVFLFADGEEQGMLGSAKFVEDHPELKDRTVLVANFEARGNTGALLMFETTQNNLSMIKMYNQAVTTPVSFSIATAVYQIMSNDTDLTRFMMAGYPGLNFSVIEGAEVYHTAEDNYAGFNRNSAAHYLETITSFANYVATENLGDLTDTQDAVFFPVLAGHMMIMSQTTANILAWAAIALCVLLLFVFITIKKARGKEIFLSLLCQLLVLAVGGGACFGIVKWIGTANNLKVANDYLRYAPAPYIFFAMLAVVTVLGGLLFLRRAKKSTCKASVALGVLPLIALVGVATTLFFPSANYMFSLTALAMCAVLILDLLLPKITTPVFAAVASVFILLLFAPIVYLVYVALNLSTSYAAVLLAQFPATAIWGMFALCAQKKQK